MHPRPSGRRPESITPREQSVLEGVLDLLTGLLQVTLGLVGPTLGLQFLVIGGPAEPLFGLPLTSWALFLALSSTPMGLVSWSSGPLLLPWVRSTKPRQGEPGSSRRLALTHMAWDGWSVPPQRGAVGRGRQQDHGVVSGPQPGSGAPGGSQVGTGPWQLHRPGRGRAHRGAVGSGLSDGGLVRQPPGGVADGPGSPGRHQRVRHPRQGAAGRLGGGSDRPDR